MFQVLIFFLIIIFNLQKPSIQLDPNEFDKSPDITLVVKSSDISSNNEYTIEAYKSILNDKIINEKQTNKFGQLKWYSLGYPILIENNANKSVLNFINNDGDFYIKIEMLTQSQREKFKNKIKHQYDIDTISPDQIQPIIADEFTCSLDLKCNKNNLQTFNGECPNRREYPIRFDFKLPQNIDSSCLMQNINNLNFEFKIVKKFENYASNNNILDRIRMNNNNDFERSFILRSKDQFQISNQIEYEARLNKIEKKLDEFNNTLFKLFNSASKLTNNYTINPSSNLINDNKKGNKYPTCKLNIFSTYFHLS
jgi:hypothetical protein